MSSERPLPGGAAPRAATLLVAGLAALLLTGCSPERDRASLFGPTEVGTPVVDALLVVGRPLPTILLSRTRAPDAVYDPAEAALRGAAVRVVMARTDTVRYQEAFGGGYRPRPAPDVPVPEVRPRTRYDLLVTTAAGERITATTTTPGPLTVREWVLLDGAGEVVQRRLRTFAELGYGVFDAPENQLVYAEGLLEARLAGPVGAGYQIALASLDLGSPLVADLPFLEEEDLEELGRVGSSPALELEDRVRLPWFGVIWQGAHILEVVVLDRNAYDLVRSSPSLSGGLGFGGSAGDGFERPLFRVEGGIGLFGAAARDSVGFSVRPAE